MILLVFAGLFAGGIALAFDGLTAPARHPAALPSRRTWVSSAEDSLHHAGLEGVSVRSFVMTSIVSGLVAAIAAQVVLGWPAVSVAAAALGTLAPLSYFGPREWQRQVGARTPAAYDRLLAARVSGQTPVPRC